MRVLLLALLIALIGCGAPRPPSGLYDAQEVTDTIGRDRDTQSEETRVHNPEGEFHPDGTWAAISATSDCELVMGKAFEVISYTLELVKFESKDGYLINEEVTTCSIQQTPLLGQTSSYSQALYDALSPHYISAVVNGHEPGSDYLQAPDGSTWGIDMKDPINDPMPTSKDDKRIVDADKDGHPGVTIHVGKLCDVYLVQRSVSRSWGKIVSPTMIEASNDSHSDVLRIGATNSVCMSQNVDIPMPEYSYLKFRRVDGRDGAINLDANHDGKIECKEFLARWKDLFKEPEENDEHCKGVGHQ